MLDKKKIFFRANWSSQIGLGHVIRSLALADMLKMDFECHFIINKTFPSLKAEILNACVSILELPAQETLYKEAFYLTKKVLAPKDIIVLDGYHFETDYQEVLKDYGSKLVCIDDIHSFHFYADVIINHGGGVSENKYSVENYTEFYLGLDYALLRRPFILAARGKLSVGSPKNVFICFGGADPNNNVLEVLKLCEKASFIDQCFLVIGGAYKHRKQLDEFLLESNLEINLLSNLSAKQMVGVMKKCGRAITSPSSISYEYLSVGGQLFLKKTADNQEDAFNYLINERIAFHLEEFLVGENITPDFTKPFDGHQDERFIKLFNKLI